MPPVTHWFFNDQTPKTIKETPTVTTSIVGETKQKHNSAPPKVIVTMGILFFLCFVQDFEHPLSITSPPFFRNTLQYIPGGAIVLQSKNLA